MASLLLPTILAPGKAQPPLVILQSTPHASAIPILRRVIRPEQGKGTVKAKRKTVVFCLFYPPSALLDYNGGDDDVELHDLLCNVPSFGDFKDPRDAINTALQDPQPTTLVIDSLDSLQSDIGSISATSSFLTELCKRSIRTDGDHTIVLHTTSSSTSPLLSSLLHSSLSHAKNVAHIVAHSPALITHVAAEYGTPPPPLGHEDRFWGVWMPVSARQATIDLTVNADADLAADDTVVDILTRGAASRRKAIERRLEGWADGTPCEVTALRSLRRIFSEKKRVIEETSTSGIPPDMNVSFNLSLSEAQQRARAQVPLPYAHEGQPLPPTAGAILYDPDSADDIDDDDPDEDLDI
ncbi:hypothetical protein BD626DRAFT_486927 [Schizophyllum amplum]|uniref:Elongator complex protein 5 n=1 Tax=Schizophyllum amplum TaxID=97359 RepID=A0A550CN21_9AGAR|nr:hypothetical protein BD626DRAFT_486927 [Auriculariopsis ampla]